MLSQYSWWDFFKVVGIGLIVYYAYVAWAYYREDIREWFSNRGQPVPVTPEVPQAEDEELQPGSIFMVKDYSESTALQTTQKAPLPAPPVVAPARVNTAEPLSNSKQVADQPASDEQPFHEEVDLEGPAVAEQPADAFGISVADEPTSLAEQSVDEIISAAGRLEADEEGMLSPIDADDKPAARIAAVINNQQGRSVFADFSFNR